MKKVQNSKRIISISTTHETLPSSAEMNKEKCSSLPGEEFYLFIGIFKCISFSSARYGTEDVAEVGNLHHKSSITPNPVLASLFGNC